MSSPSKCGVVGPAEQRRLDGESPEEPGHGVGVREAGVHGWPVGEAGQVDDAAHRLADLAETGAVALGRVPAEAADLEHDQLRVDGVQRVPVEAPPLERAEPEVRDHDVGPRAQAPGDVLAFGGTEIERHRALVATGHLPPEVDAVLGDAGVASRVAVLLVLDVHDVGPEVGEEAAGHRTGDELGDLDHPQPLERSPIQRHVVRHPRNSSRVAAQLTFQTILTMRRISCNAHDPGLDRYSLRIVVLDQWPPRGHPRR